mmetsp:Transcript_58639/g.182123  ORF Transcript_58639/g.182123 Transcript_58639/m.182123 type:complete len:700 (+) Transcript_58639:72-2171(+)
MATRGRASSAGFLDAVQASLDKESEVRSESSFADWRDDRTESESRRVVRSAVAMKNDLQTNLHKELFSLLLQEEQEQSKLEAVRSKTKSFEERSRKTEERIQKVLGALKAPSEQPMISVSRKKELLAENHARVEELARSREESQARMETTRREVAQQVEEYEQLVRTLEKDVYYLNHKITGETLYDGPYCLRWVDGEKFRAVSISVVAVNLLLMFISFREPGFHTPVLNEIFLVFYTVELVLNLLFKQIKFLVGDPNVVLWNWLDVVIVVTGLIHKVASLDTTTHQGALAKLPLPNLQFLRFARVARVFKILRVIFSDLAWAEGPAFQSFMMAVIGTNCLLMGAETDYPDWRAWPYINGILLCIYIFELGIRMHHLRREFIFGARTEVAWNILDTTIVLGGVFDFWLLPAVEALTGHTLGTNFNAFMSLIRMARLARILRLIKLVRNIPPLYLLIVGIAKAMQGMIWVLVLTTGVLYISALLGVKFVGEGWVLPEGLKKEEAREVMDCFPDIPTAACNLFQAMNADLSPVEPLLAHVPIARFAMMIYVIITNWAIFSVLTAVVGDNMLSVSDEHAAELEEEEAKAKRAPAMAKLESLFARIDTNGDDIINMEEFLDAMEDSELRQEVCLAAGMEDDEVEEIFHLLSHSQSASDEEVLSRHDFIQYLIGGQCNAVNAHSIIKVERHLQNIEHALEEPGAA